MEATETRNAEDTPIKATITIKIATDTILVHFPRGTLTTALTDTIETIGSIGDRLSPGNLRSMTGGIYVTFMRIETAMDLTNLGMMLVNAIIEIAAGMNRTENAHRLPMILGINNLCLIATTKAKIDAGAMMMTMIAIISNKALTIVKHKETTNHFMAMTT